MLERICKSGEDQGREGLAGGVKKRAREIKSKNVFIEVGRSGAE